MKQKQFDLIVFGATSFVGQILVQYLWKRHGLDGEVKWAIAGRDSAKLDVLKNRLGERARDLPLLLANASNEAELQALCAQTRVVVSTVGPYALYGSPLVKVCAETGTDYCDLTGEVQWIARMIEQHEETARQTGARIVHCCGFDSIPSDLGVYFLQQAATEKFGEPCQQVRMRGSKIERRIFRRYGGQHDQCDARSRCRPGPGQKTGKSLPDLPKPLTDPTTQCWFC